MQTEADKEIAIRDERILELEQQVRELTEAGDERAFDDVLDAVRYALHDEIHFGKPTDKRRLLRLVEDAL